MSSGGSAAVSAVHGDSMMHAQDDDLNRDTASIPSAASTSTRHHRKRPHTAAVGCATATAADNVSADKGPAHQAICRRRWTDEERHILFKHFGSDITAKSMPSGKRLIEVARKMNYARTVAQIRTQVNNYINGKIHV